MSEMPALLSSLEQISLCSQSISELPFQGPRRFTNAILSNHDITALLRDTQSHERALFHLAPPDELSKPVAGPAPIAATRSRRTTVHNSRQPRNKAVAAILGGDLYNKIQQQDDRGRGQVDVEALLQGAEKLSSVYPIAGAPEQIAKLRRRHRQLEANISHYEGRVEEQRLELDKMNIAGSVDLEIDIESAETAEDGDASIEDLQTTQDEINKLEQKKQTLERRVHGIEKDLGG